MKSLQWKVEHCPDCQQIAVKSLDEFWGCLQCQVLLKPHDYPEGCCVFCGTPLVMLMEGCLHCGRNQPT